MRAVEQAKLIVISGAGLEEFMGDTLASCDVVIDASEGLALLPGEEGESDPRTWLAPENMIAMTHTVETARSPRNIRSTPPCSRKMRTSGAEKLDELQSYRRAASCRSLLPQARHLPRRLCLLCRGFLIWKSLPRWKLKREANPSARELEEIIPLLQDQGIPRRFHRDQRHGRRRGACRA